MPVGGIAEPGGVAERLDRADPAAALHVAHVPAAVRADAFDRCRPGADDDAAVWFRLAYVTALDAGTFGTVYRAELFDHGGGGGARTVAVKRIQRSGDGGRHELDAHRRLRHPNVVQIYDVGDALGPIAAGVLISCVGYSRMFQVIAAFALTMAIVFAVASRFDPAARAVARS